VSRANRFAGCIACLVLAAGTAHAQVQTSLGVPARGHGSVTLSIHQAEASKRVRPEAFGGGLIDQGDVTLRTATLELDYGLTDRLALDVSLPYRYNRYDGATPHNPAVLQDDHGEPFLDDGDFHGGWGDWGVGLRWLWRTEPFVVTPFVTAHFPATDYPIFTATARGTQQWRLDVGVNAGGRFRGALRNLTWQAGYAFMFMEKTRIADGPDHRVNHSLVNFQLGYAMSPQWTYSVAWRYRKAHGALRMPQDFNFPLTDDLWYHHDQLLGLEQAVVEAGVSYQLNDRYSVYASFGRTNHVAFGQEIERAFGFGVSRGF
jgi:hypothetical protein